MAAHRDRYFEVIDDVNHFLSECFDLDHELPRGLVATVLVRDRKSRRKIAATWLEGSRGRKQVADPERPLFASLPDLPDDVSEAFESLKLAIKRHALSGWVEISRGGMIATLEALKDLTATQEA